MTKAQDDLRSRVAAKRDEWIRRSVEMRAKATEASKKGNQAGADLLVGDAVTWNAAADELTALLRGK